MAAPAINLSAFSAEQLKDLLVNIKKEMNVRKKEEQCVSLRTWHADIKAKLAEARAEKNAELVAAGKERINATHIAMFLRWWHIYSFEYANNMRNGFLDWVESCPHIFREVKPQLPKIKPEDLPVEERLRRLGNAAKHINKRVVDLTAKVAALEAAEQDETTLRILAKVKDLLARSKETQRKFVEKHC